VLILSPVLAQAPHGNPAAAGVGVLVHDREMFANGVQNPNNWEAYTTAFGDGTLALATNTEEQGDNTPSERAVVGFFNADGSVVEAAGFFSDAGAPWTTINDIARTDGNPPRIAGDKRPGGTKYVLGNEATPWADPELFPSFIAAGFTYTQQVASVQLLNKVGNTPTPIGKVLDPINGKLTTGAQSDQMRFGGEIRALSNGNFVVIVDNRDGAFGGDIRTVPFAIIDQNTGLVTIGPLNANQVPLDPGVNTGTWSNLASFNGGFAVRCESNSATIDFFDNNGNALGTWDRTLRRTDFAEPLPPANGMNTSIMDNGGGGGRIDSHINSNFIYVAGKGIDSVGSPQAGVYLTKINAQTRQTVKEVLVSEGFTAIPDRINVCSDKDDNVFVAWSDTSNTGKRQIIGRAFDSNLAPVTDAFLVFEHSDVGPEEVVGFAVKHPSCSMSGGRVLVTGRIDNDAGGVESLSLQANAHYAVVLQLPVTAIDNWILY
jgi:hypothetical protein